MARPLNRMNVFVHMDNKSNLPEEIMIACFEIGGNHH